MILFPGVAPADRTSRAAADKETSWLDSLWVKHLHTRAQAVSDRPLLREAFLRDALRIRPTDQTTLERLAAAYQDAQMRPMARAIQTYTRHVVRSSPGHPPRPPENLSQDVPGWGEADDSTYRDVMEQFASNRFLEAEVGLRNLLIKFPRDARLYKDLGTLYLQTQDWPMAAAVLAEAHRLTPEDLALANDLAVCFAEVGRPDQVTELLESMLQRHPGEIYLVQNISVYAALAGDLDKARAFAEQWVALAPDSREARDHLASLPTPPSRAPPSQ